MARMRSASQWHKLRSIVDRYIDAVPEADKLAMLATGTPSVTWVTIDDIMQVATAMGYRAHTDSLGVTRFTRKDTNNGQSDTGGTEQAAVADRRVVAAGSR